MEERGAGGQAGLGLRCVRPSTRLFEQNSQIDGPAFSFLSFFSCSKPTTTADQANGGRGGVEMQAARTRGQRSKIKDRWERFS